MRLVIKISQLRHRHGDGYFDFDLYGGGFVFVGYVFSSEVISAMEKQSKDLVSAVMKRAEAVYAKFSSNVSSG